MIRGEGPVLVIGAGIAGPVAAMALQRVGLDCAVYEAYPEPAHGIGAFMTVASNGLDALAALEADQPVMDAGFPTLGMAMWSGTGRKLGELPSGAGRPTVTLRREDLYGALYDEAARRGVRFVHGKRLVGADLGADRVVARFADGTEATGSLLVGTDGLRSVTRALIEPHPPGPQYVGLVGLGGYARGLSLPIEPGVFHFVFGKRAFFGYISRGDGEVWWFANLPTPREPSPEALASVSPSQWQERLLDLFAQDAVPAVPIISATTESFEPSLMHTLSPLSRWHGARTVLVGDAAHVTSPSSGQGASLAMEDAVQLARCLRDREALPDAFSAYQRLREERVVRVMREAARVNNAKAAGPVGRVLRDLFMPIFLKRMSHLMDQPWLYGHHIEFERSIDAA
jgi:FAD-dependent urate hydroxylase